MDEMKEFYTRGKANEGIEVPLLKANGEKSNHWLRIRGVDSDAFREAELDARRHLAEIAAKEPEKEANKEERGNFRKHLLSESKKLDLVLVQSLIIGWSFEAEFNDSNCRSFLVEAPNIADRVNKIAGTRMLFFGSWLGDSTNTQDQSSDSTSSQKAVIAQEDSSSKESGNPRDENLKS